MENCSSCSSCRFLTMEEKILLYDVKFWMEGVIQVLYLICQCIQIIPPTTFFQLSLAVIGVITNAVSIYVLSRKELINTFNQLLITLAFFDILYLVIMFLDSLGK